MCRLGLGLVRTYGRVRCVCLAFVMSERDCTCVALGVWGYRYVCTLNPLVSWPSDGLGSFEPRELSLARPRRRYAHDRGQCAISFDLAFVARELEDVERSRYRDTDGSRCCRSRSLVCAAR